MNNYEKYMDNIINSIHQIRDNEFKLNNYIPKINEVKKKK